MAREAGSWDGEILPRNLFYGFPSLAAFLQHFSGSHNVFPHSQPFSHSLGTDSISRNLSHFPLTKPILGTDSFFRTNSN